MLKTASDFENSIKFLLSGVSEEMHEGLKYQTVALDSESFNETFNVIESRLDILYEKIRTMEDIILYTRQFLEQNIYDTIKECNAILTTIEEDRDKLKSNAYISYEIPFIQSTGAYTDRDNSVLPYSSINNNVITMSGSNEIDVSVANIERVSSNIPYKSNINDIMTNKSYRTFYVLDKPVNNGLCEEIIIKFNSPTTINFIDVITSNCNILNVVYIDQNGFKEHAEEYPGVITKDRTVVEVRITLASDLYKTNVYYIDNLRTDQDFWSKLKDQEYNLLMNISNIADVDELTGISKFREDYNTYLQNVMVWKAEREKIVNANVTNGYYDAISDVSVSMADAALAGIDSINKINKFDNPYPTIEQSY